MYIINEVKIVLSKYHDDIVGRLEFINPSNGKTEDSNLYSLSEINNIISLWKNNGLLGSFAINTKLAIDANIILINKE